MSSVKNFMELALDQARTAVSAGEVPVGAVIVHTITGKVAAAAHNLTETHNDPSAHAELLVIRDVCNKVKSPRLPDYDLYVTLEPCAMCATAISFARIRRVYFAAYDVKGGGVDHGCKVFDQPTCHHRPEVYGGIMEKEGAALLQQFFIDRR